MTDRFDTLDSMPTVDDGDQEKSLQASMNTVRQDTGTDSGAMSSKIPDWLGKDQPRGSQEEERGQSEDKGYMAEELAGFEVIIISTLVYALSIAAIVVSFYQKSRLGWRDGEESVMVVLGVSGIVFSFIYSMYRLSQVAAATNGRLWARVIFGIGLCVAAWFCATLVGLMFVDILQDPPRLKTLLVFGFGTIFLFIVGCYGLGSVLGFTSIGKLEGWIRKTFDGGREISPTKNSCSSREAFNDLEAYTETKQARPSEEAKQVDDVDP
jgi:hypothetical protein